MGILISDAQSLMFMITNFCPCVRTSPSWRSELREDSLIWVGMQNKARRLGRLSPGEGAGLLFGPFARESTLVTAIPRMEG